VGCVATAPVVGRRLALRIERAARRIGRAKRCSNGVFGDPGDSSAAPPQLRFGRDLGLGGLNSCSAGLAAAIAGSYAFRNLGDGARSRRAAMCCIEQASASVHHAMPRRFRRVKPRHVVPVCLRRSEVT